MPETMVMLELSFDANVKLIESQWRAAKCTSQAQAERYQRLNTLLEQGVFNVLGFAKTERQERRQVNVYVMERLSQFVDLLGLALARHYRVKSLSFEQVERKL